MIHNAGLLQLDMTNLDLLTLLMCEKLPSHQNFHPIRASFTLVGATNPTVYDKELVI